MIPRIETKIIVVIFLIGAVLLAPNLVHAQTSGQPQWVQLSTTGGPPAPRYVHTSVFDSATHQMIIFAGSGTQNYNDTWSLGLTGSPQWTQLLPVGTPPAPRQHAAGVYDENSSSLIIFGGGLGNTSPCANDTWVLSNADGVSGVPAWTQLATAAGPPAPRFAPAVYDAASNTMIIFGGSSCFYYPSYNDVWTLSNANGLGGTPTWTQLSPSGTPPSPRESFTAVYDGTSNTMIIFGGVNGTTTFLNDVWTLSNANGLGGTPTWTQLSPSGTPPSSRVNHTAVYDPATNTMTVFGGSDATSLLNDVWTLSNANGLGGTPTWTQLSPSGTPPSPRAAHAAVYDPTTGNMIIFGGGGDNGFLNDTWVLSPLTVNLSANTLTFGNQPLGSPSAPQTVTLTNTGSAPLSITSIAASGDFSQTNTCGTSVNAGENCSIDVTFTPTVVGARSGTITIADNAPNSPQAINLSGVGEYGVCALYDQTRSVKSGATFPIKLYLCDGGGNDLSSSAAVVHATGVYRQSTFVGEPEDAGNSNPDYDFRFDSTQGPAGGYIYNLKTTGLGSGTYSLQFTAGSDPNTHWVAFGVK